MHATPKSFEVTSGPKGSTVNANFAQRERPNGFASKGTISTKNGKHMF